jgi:hypothetical protein
MLAFSQRDNAERNYAEGQYAECPYADSDKLAYFVPAQLGSS